MRILYLVTLDNIHDTGKIYKIRDRLNYWRRAGHLAQVWILSRDHEYAIRGLSEQEGVKVFNALPFHLRLSGRLSWVKKTERYIRQAVSLRQLSREIALFQPELIYYHQHIWLPGLAGLLHRHLSVMEVNVIDTEEVKFTPLLRRWIYRAGRKSLIRSVDGLVCVTPEIEARFKRYGKPSCVISNGIDLNRIPLKRPDPSGRAHLIFVGSSDIPSQGIDLVIRLARRLPQYVFHIVCPDLPVGKQQNIISHGALCDTQLKSLYMRMDIGIGTLALHRKHMQQACPLKVREYIAAGLPLILAYEDCDLPDDPHILRLPYGLQHLDDAWVSKIEAFVERNRLKRLSESIRQRVALERKEVMRLAFFEHLLNGYRTNHLSAFIFQPASEEAIAQATEPSSVQTPIAF
ncbi:glycosyltransferase involved in cell wall biosynthesis [Thermoflavifilum aggregans]|uniref:Glycosyltransferase involved in cell wall biosynthesis n=1 Tax=Thermoflavifilum aggregans TaxID=454188 RepID=A0A2M9CX31_9BACT|nr:glycosyltransferase [Thermoflavifilum aggregans]PJJ76368.1 glycosyltransferase involved in cell wall biosynthesis [Thermoflavifilum aggregans]